MRDPTAHARSVLLSLLHHCVSWAFREEKHKKKPKQERGQCSLHRQSPLPPALPTPAQTAPSAGHCGHRAAVHGEILFGDHGPFMGTLCVPRERRDPP